MVKALGMLEAGLRECFDCLLEKCQELVRDCTVDDAMIERDRKVRARSDRDDILPVRTCQHFRAFLDRSDPEYRDLRLIDDRWAQQRAKNSRIGDGERSFLHFFRCELLRASACSEIVQCASDSR